MQVTQEELDAANELEQVFKDQTADKKEIKKKMKDTFKARRKMIVEASPPLPLMEILEKCPILKEPKQV